MGLCGAAELGAWSVGAARAEGLVQTVEPEMVIGTVREKGWRDDEMAEKK